MFLSRFPYTAFSSNRRGLDSRLVSEIASRRGRNARSIRPNLHSGRILPNAPSAPGCSVTECVTRFMELIPTLACVPSMPMSTDVAVLMMPETRGEIIRLALAGPDSRHTGSERLLVRPAHCGYSALP